MRQNFNGDVSLFLKQLFIQPLLTTAFNSSKYPQEFICSNQNTQTTLLPSARLLQQGIIFTSACHSVHRGCLPDIPLGRHTPGQTLPWQKHLSGRQPLQGRHPPGRHPPDRHPLADTRPGSLPGRHPSPGQTPPWQTHPTLGRHPRGRYTPNKPPGQTPLGRHPWQRPPGRHWWRQPPRQITPWKTHHTGQTAPWADTFPVQKPPPPPTPAEHHPPADGYCCGRYASYWNAFFIFYYQM